MNPALTPSWSARPPWSQGVCARPVISKVTDLETGEIRLVPISCGRPGRTAASRVRSGRGGCGCSSAGRAGTSTPNPNGNRPTTRTRPGDDEDEGDERRRVLAAGALDPAPPGRPRAAAGPGRGSDGRAGVHGAGWQDLPALDVRDPHPRARTGGSQPRACRSTRSATTTGGPRWMRCTSPSWWTGSGRTCAAARATRSSTSPPSNPNAASLRTCTRPSAGRSLGRCCARSGPPPTTRSGGHAHDTAGLCRPAAGLDRAGLHRPDHRRAAAHVGRGARRASTTTPTRCRRTWCGSGTRTTSRA